MTNSSVADKLQIKSGETVLLLNAPEEYLYLLGNPENVSIFLKPRGVFDMVQVFVKNKVELGKKTEIALKSLMKEGTLWITYPKLAAGAKSSFTQDKVWNGIKEYGFKEGEIISIDNSWSAISFKRSETETTLSSKDTDRMEFVARLESPAGMETVYFIVPFNVYRIYRTKLAVKVKGTVEGHPFHSTLAPRGKGLHYMVVTKDMTGATGKKAGDIVRVAMELDR